MDKKEFFSILRESLEGNIPREEVEQNITYYRNYFDESEKTEQEVIAELGDPRLIARTVIEAYRASKGPMADYYTEQARSEYSRGQSGDYEETDRNFSSGDEPAWYEKIFGWGVLILILAAVLSLVIVIAGAFVKYVLPVALLIIVLKILMDYFKR